MTFAGLAAKNLLRNKVRTLLTILAVAVAVLTFVTLRTLVGAFTTAQDYAAKDRLVTRHKITIIMTLPLRYAEQLRGIEGVKDVTFSNWFGGKDTRYENEFFATIAVDSKTFFDVYKEMVVSGDVLARWKANRSGAIVGDVVARKLGWKVGDRVTLTSSIYMSEPDKPWTFTIEGIYRANAKSVDRSTFILHWDYINDGLEPSQRDNIGWITARVHDPSKTASLALAIDKMFEEGEVQTLTRDERALNASFLASVSAAFKAIDLISAAILAIMVLVVGNTIAMGVRERSNEYGVLRAIGFLPRHIVVFVFGEAMLLGFLGGGLGLAISYPVVEGGFGRWIEENMGSIFPYFRIEPLVALYALALSIVLGAIAAAIPSITAYRLHVTDALRRVA